MPIKLNSSGGGSVTIDVPSTASSYTLTAPTVSANLLTSSSQSIPKAALPTGSILQVVNYVTSSSVTINSGSYTATGYSATITPTSATSKVLFTLAMTEFRVPGNVGANISLYRNGSLLTAIAREFGYSAGAGGTQWNATLGLTPSGYYLDSPATTSATTYAVYARILTNSGNVEFLPNGTATLADKNLTITLTEIAA